MGAFRFRFQVLLDHRMDTLKRAEEVCTARERELVIEQRTMMELLEEAGLIESLYRRKRLERLSVGRSVGASFNSRSSRLVALEIDVQVAQAGILSQQVFVDQAQDALDEARVQMEVRRREVDILEKYRKKAEQKFIQEEAHREELEQDEIGNVMHLSRRGNG